MIEALINQCPGISDLHFKKDDLIIKALYQRVKMVNESIPRFLSITPPDEMYLAMHHLMDADRKRLCPSTLLVAAEAVGGEPEDVIPAALAVELIHNVCLIHNDIMDNADMRKGYLTVHKIWGASGGILAGDALYSKAFEILSYAKSGPSQIIESMQILSRTYIDLCEGQWMDIDFQKRNDVTESEYLQMAEKKTAVLFAAGLKIGAVLSNASREEAQALWDFGCLTGVGFQIYDDIKILKETGSIDYALKVASSFIDAGKSALKILPDSEAKKILIGFADYMIEQKY